MGCDSVATLVLTVNQTSNSTTNQTICNNQLPFLWNGNNYNTAGSFNTILVNAVGCDSIATLILTVNQTSSSTTNQTICNNQLPFSWNGNNYNAAGSYNVNFVNAAGCDSIATLILKVNQTTSSTTNHAICINQLPYNWNGNNYNAAGNYNVTLTNAAGCDSVATLVLAVLQNTISNQAVATCNSFYTLPNGVIARLSGLYTSVIANTAGCDSIIKTTVTFNASPILKISNPAAICATATTDLTAINITAGSSTGITLGYWNNASTTDTLNNPVTAAPGTYFIKAMNAAGCSKVKPVIVSIQPAPVLYAGKDSAICLNTKASLHGSISNLIGNPNYSWSPSNLLNRSDTTFVIASMDTSTLFILTVTVSQAGCNYNLKDSVFIIVQPPVKAFAGNDTNAVYGKPIQLKATGGMSYLWQPVHLLNNATIVNPQATLFNDTKLVVTAFDQSGCFGTDTILIKVFVNEGYYVPNAFSPNGDHNNDIFRPIPVGIVSTDFFRIFNRMGELVFETRTYMAGWDGNFKGKLQQPGNYVWVLQGRAVSGKIITMKGNVVLIL